MGAAMNMQPVNLAEEFSSLAFALSRTYVRASLRGLHLIAANAAKRIEDLGMQVEGIVATEAHCARWDADREWENM